MGEFLKETYFTIVRIILVITFSIYGVLGINEGTRKTGVSIEILLLVSFSLYCFTSSSACSGVGIYEGRGEQLYSNWFFTCF